MEFNNKILISFSGDHWIDRTNGIRLLKPDMLIDYVNKNKLVVLNDECFLDKSKFWYSDHTKKEPLTTNQEALLQNK